MVRECPNCGLANPPTALRCDCGYEFAAGHVTAPPIPGTNPGPAPGTPLMAGCLGAFVGVALGVLTAVPLRIHAASEAAADVRAENGSVCGLIILPFLFEGVVWGAALGGPAGAAAFGVLSWVLTRR